MRQIGQDKPVFWLHQAHIYWFLIICHGSSSAWSWRSGQQCCDCVLCDTSWWENTCIKM